MHRDGAVDALRLSHNVGITCADDDARVTSVCEVQSSEVTAIEGQHRSVVPSRHHDYLGVPSPPIREAKLGNRRNIVAQPTKLIHDSQGEILV